VVIRFRSTNKNTQDYVPFYRYLPKSARTKTALSDRAVRDVWLNELFQKVVDGVSAGRKSECISAGLIKDDSSAKMTEAEIKSITVSFVSGGFETLATSANSCISWLSTDEGQLMQEKAFQDIMKHHDSIDTAWDECVLEEKSPYVVALVREGLRYYCPIPLLPPRQTMKPFTWRGIEIPKGLTVHINTQSVNHDPACYGPDAHLFRPERWLEDGLHTVKQPGPPYQYSYGAGSRMCPAVAISNRLLYATYVRLFIHFRIKASKDALPNVDYVHFNMDRSAQSALSKRYKIKLERREYDMSLEKSIERSQKATNGLYE
jgi:phenylacetate 2-hydroxylase